MLQLEQIRRNLRQILKLTLPITTSFVAMGIMGIVDTMIVGNYQTDQLAYIGLANSVFVVLFTIPIGLLQGVLIKSSQKFGARKFASCGKIYNEGRRYLIVLSVIFTLIGFNGELVLRLLGQNEDMVTHGGRVLRVFVVSIPFILIYVNANFFLQSIKRPYVAMYGIIVANILNIMINPVLVYGKFGLPELGAVGSATSTLIVRIFLALYMLYYIKRMTPNSTGVSDWTAVMTPGGTTAARPAKSVTAQPSPQLPPTALFRWSALLPAGWDSIRWPSL